MFTPSLIHGPHSPSIGGIHLPGIVDAPIQHADHAPLVSFTHVYVCKLQKQPHVPVGIPSAVVQLAPYEALGLRQGVLLHQNASGHARGFETDLFKVSSRLSC